LAIGLLLLLAACSSTTFVYNRLHIVIPWLVDDYVELDDHQDNSLQQLLADYLHQHRREHLPRYVAILDQGLTTLDGDIGSADLAALYQQVESELRREQRQSLGWILAVGESLSDKQIAEFIASLRDKQTELADEYLERDDKAFRQETYEELEDHLTDYLGNLTAQQKAALERLAGDLVRFDQLWLDERAQWIDRMEAILQREPGWQQQVRDAVVQRYDLAPAHYKDVYNRNLATTLDSLASVIDSRSDKQDRHLRNKLSTLRKDLCLLIAEGGDSDSHQAVAKVPCTTAVASGAANVAENSH
jgi:predicted phage tail protein